MIVNEIKEIAQAFTVLRDPYFDHRGSFCEVFKSCDIPIKFVQRNVSVSKKNVLRGMHSMTFKPQGKLVTCLSGQIVDVIFDARPKSPTFKKGYAITLDSSKTNSIYCPPGCLHGFLVLSDLAVVEYDCTAYYQNVYDGGVNWRDPNILKFFPLHIEPIISIKDSKLGSLDEFLDFKR